MAAASSAATASWPARSTRSRSATTSSSPRSRATRSSTPRRCCSSRRSGARRSQPVDLYDRGAQEAERVLGMYDVVRAEPEEALRADAIVVFVIAAACAIGSALAVVLQRNPFTRRSSLILNLASLATLYLLLQADFVAAAQVIVYAGAVMVMFLFVIAYLGDRADELADERGTAWQTWAAIVAGSAVLVEIVLAVAIQRPAAAPAIVPRAVRLAAATIGELFLTDVPARASRRSRCCCSWRAIAGVVLGARHLRRRAARRRARRRPTRELQAERSTGAASRAPCTRAASRGARTAMTPGVGVPGRQSSASSSASAWSACCSRRSPLVILLLARDHAELRQPRAGRRSRATCGDHDGQVFALIGDGRRRGRGRRRPRPDRRARAPRRAARRRSS